MKGVCLLWIRKRVFPSKYTFFIITFMIPVLLCSVYEKVKKTYTQSFYLLYQNITPYSIQVSFCKEGGCCIGCQICYWNTGKIVVCVSTQGTLKETGRTQPAYKVKYFRVLVEMKDEFR